MKRRAIDQVVYTSLPCGYRLMSSRDGSYSVVDPQWDDADRGQTVGHIDPSYRTQTDVLGRAREIVYADVCNRLGMRADIRFVKITDRGSITFTSGKPEEVRLLLRRVRETGMRAAASLVSAAV